MLKLITEFWDSLDPSNLKNMFSRATPKVIITPIPTTDFHFFISSLVLNEFSKVNSKP